MALSRVGLGAVLLVPNSLFMVVGCICCEIGVVQVVGSGGAIPDHAWPVLNRTAIGGPRGSLPDFWDKYWRLKQNPISELSILNLLRIYTAVARDSVSDAEQRQWGA